MDNLLSETAKFTQERKTFGKSVFDNQAIQFRLSELATEMEALRALVYTAIGSFQIRRNFTSRKYFIFSFQKCTPKAKM